MGAAILGVPEVGRCSSSNHKMDMNQAAAGGWQRVYVVPGVLDLVREVGEGFPR